MKNYKFGFDIWGFVLFVVIMVPNIIWYMIPAPNDVLRSQSVTGVLDAVSSVLQVIFVIALCLVVNCKRKKLAITPLTIAVIGCCVIYFITWAFYYNAVAAPIVILSLCISPCVAFLLLALVRKNMVAVVPIAAFAVCHLIYGVVNFIL